MAGKPRCPRQEAERQEAQYLSRYATKSTDRPAATREYPQDPDDFRTEFERDYTRIIHSRAFRRLRHKTQVFISPQNDHLCTRLEHSLYVASVARTISKALHLNNELVAAIAVGHDLGHAPFGHEGEKCLDELAQKYGLHFSHELQSLRMVDEIDSPYPDHCGLNLTFAVRDGIACHYGEGFERKLEPNRKKQPCELERTSQADLPATLEGCVVRMADKVAYLGRDLEDCLNVKMIRRQDIPKIVSRVLGLDNRSIIASLVSDIVKNSRCKDFIAVSARVHEALNEFEQFNDRRIYSNRRVTQYFKQVQDAMEFMFREFLTLVEQARERRQGNLFPRRRENCVQVLRQFLEDDVRSWGRQKPAQLVVDYIAGMTDSFFIESFKELFLPRSTV